jgi:hypothetical protein
MTREELEKGIYESGMVINKAFEHTLSCLGELDVYIQKELEIDTFGFRINKVSTYLYTRRRYQSNTFRYNGSAFSITCDVVLSEDSPFAQMVFSPFVVWQIQLARQERSFGDMFQYEELPHIAFQKDPEARGNWEALSNWTEAFVIRREVNNSTRLVFYTPWIAMLNEFRAADNGGMFSVISDILRKLTLDRFKASYLNAENNLITLQWDDREERLMPASK